VEDVAEVEGVAGAPGLAGSVAVDDVAGAAGVAGLARAAAPCEAGCANAALERPRVAASAAMAKVFDIW
jgi:hypothetical protein